ncbi:Predicted protein [Taphrina deformans PYCC 5710]|uniref:OTU domain-containing protein n=1 Tax=Taphrina deformans (strain PYCC 5710 / ATCC 11124 / CBS 356.35 / IMI 108563 / JCM 9778 / NBRC 8474) TaxID=1097556 RepID=R4X952_TAPDE|nr:Predicted protein [Taphrina deformans PYCC 5710]|eukprot:CCG82188.1 Predicted protein [Taphrina deformans PYCC 5710]
MGKKERHNDKSHKRHRLHHVPDAADYGGKALEHELAAQGLYIKEITGDGNCLFRSLADQVGEPNSHAQIRHNVVHYLRQCKDEFSLFVEEDYDKYLDRMFNDGVYGDNLEIVAYSRLKDKAIKIYQPGLAYAVLPEGKTAQDYRSNEMLHIAYHSYEHYSSVRNKDGPHEGPSQVQPKATSVPDPAQRPPDAAPSDLEKICLASVPGVELSAVRHAMADCQGNVNAAIEQLLERQSEAEAENALAESIQQSTLGDAEIESAKIESAENDLIESAMLKTAKQKSETPTELVSKDARVKPGKRPSAREKKEEAKKAQKAAARERKRLGKAHVAEQQSSTQADSGKMISI